MKIESSHLFGEEAQKYPVVFKAIRFSSASICGVPQLGTRESGRLKFFESSLHPRHQDRSRTRASSFHPPLPPAFKTQDLERLSKSPKSNN